MALPLPSALSPSRISSFKDCGLAFRFATIDKLPEPPSLPATTGSLVHRALELLFCRPGPERTRLAAVDDLEQAWSEFSVDPDLLGLDLSDADLTGTRERTVELVDRYFELEDPAPVEAVGLELKLAARVGGATVRGIIDRLELDGDGGLVVTDYKTGKAPSLMSERQRMLGVHVYSEMVEQNFGVRPSRVQLLYLSTPVAISTAPTEQSARGVRRRIDAIWAAVERACDAEDFRPRTGPLCNWCSFSAYCPAQGGDPEAAWALSAANPAAAGSQVVELSRAG